MKNIHKSVNHLFDIYTVLYRTITQFLGINPTGITRKTIIDLAIELKIPFQEKKITVEDVFGADESFFSGTAAEVVPINSLDNQKIGTGLTGPVTEKLQKTYFDQVRGEREANNGWHTFTN